MHGYKPLQERSVYSPAQATLPSAAAAAVSAASKPHPPLGDAGESKNKKQYVRKISVMECFALYMAPIKLSLTSLG